MKISEKLNGLFIIMQKILPKRQNTFKVVDYSNEKDVESFKQVSDFCENLSCFSEIEKQNILEELALVQNKLERAHVIFNFQTDIDLIESLIYYIESLESRYNYLIKRAREMHLKCALKSI